MKVWRGVWVGWLAAAALVTAARAAAEPGDLADVRRRALAVEARLIEVIERARPAVVAVFRQVPGAEGAPGAGSGVLIDARGHALTNYHVVGQSIEVRCGLPDGRIYAAKVVGRDPTGDIALLQLKGRDAFPCVPLGDSDDLQPGDWAIALGNPFNLATDFQPAVTLGIVSGLKRYIEGQGDNTLIYTDAIQIDTPINPGNSGGPLLNARGELVGINGRIAGRPGRGRVNVGTGFAISINQIKRFLPMLEAGRDVYHARLGVVVQAREEGGVVVAEVLPDSAAQEADLRPGDVILRFNGQPVLSRQHLVNMIGVLPAGTDAVVTVLRDGEQSEVEVELEGLPAGSAVLAGRGRGKALVPASTPVPAEQTPTAEAILAACVTARGGREALEAVRGTRTEAEATIYGPRRITAQVVLYATRAGRYRSELKATLTSRRGSREVKQEVAETRGFDGASGWIARAPGGVAAMPGNEVEELRRETLESEILHHGAHPPGLTLAVLGLATIGDRRVHVVLADGPDLGKRWWYFDADSHLLVRTRCRSLTNGLWRAEDLSDYRPVSGVQVPFRVEGYSGDRMSVDLVVKSVTVENALDEALFKTP